MVREVKRTALRECWLHFWFRFNVAGRSCGLGPPRRRAFSPLMIDATMHRCAPLFQVGDLSTQKSDADAGDRQVWEQTGERRFAGLLPCRDQMGHKYKFTSFVECRVEGTDPRSIRRCTFYISLKLLFRRNQHNETLVPYVFPAVSLWRWLGRSRNLFAKLMARSHGLRRALTSGPIHYLFCDRSTQMCCFLRASTTARAILR